MRGVASKGLSAHNDTAPQSARRVLWWIVMKKSMIHVALMLMTAMACSGEFNPRQPAEEGSGNEVQVPTFEQFKLQTARDEQGGYMVNGDESIENEDELFSFWSALYQSDNALTIIAEDGIVQKVSDVKKRNLTYCVDNVFGANKAQVIEALRQASDLGWEKYGDINFTYVPAQDSNCTSTNLSVAFNVKSVTSLPGGAPAKAPFPHFSRNSQILYIANAAFTNGSPLAGLMKHELGHVLGFRHEQVRPEAGRCLEDFNWKAVTAYDSASVMHYPNCGGTGGNQEISPRDIEGVIRTYGPSSSQDPVADLTITPWGNKSSSMTGTFTANSTRMLQLGRYNTAPDIDLSALDQKLGSPFSARLSGTGDADLYVRFDAPPTLTTYDCRSNGASSAELCSMEARGTVAYVGIVVKTGGTISAYMHWTEGRTKNESVAFDLLFPLGAPHRLKTASGGAYYSVVAGSAMSVQQTYTKNKGLLSVIFGPSPEIVASCNTQQWCKVTVPAGKTRATIEIGTPIDDSNAGNVNVTWVDKLPPTPTCTIDAVNPTIGTPATTFKVSWDGPLSGKCSIELDYVSKGTVPCDGATAFKEFSGLAVGSHKVKIRPVSVDGVHGVCERSFTVSGSLPPLPTCTLTGPATGTADSWYTGTYSSTDATSCTYEVVGPTPSSSSVSCNGASVSTALSPGKYYAIFSANNAAGSVQCQSENFSVAPTCNIDSDPTSGTLSANTAFGISYSSNGGTTCTYNIDGNKSQPLASCNGNATVYANELGAGPHTIRMNAKHESGFFRQCTVDLNIAP